MLNAVLKALGIRPAEQNAQWRDGYETMRRDVAAWLRDLELRKQPWSTGLLADAVEAGEPDGESDP